MFNSDIILGKQDAHINQQFTHKLAQVLFSIYQDNALNFVIGKDTRKNNNQTEKTLARVLASLGANVFLLGTTSTGAVSCATSLYKATAGIMITGSSKPGGFVGFKIFNGNGYKISDHQLEAIKYKFKNISALEGKATQGKIFCKPYFNLEYINHLKNFSKANHQNHNLKILADFSCGSAEHIYGQLCKALGIKQFVASGGQNCENINKTYQRAKICKKTQFKVQDFFGQTKQYKNFFDFKIVFDADCDKFVLFDAKGRKIDTEKLIMLFAKNFKLNLNSAKVVVGPFVNTKMLTFFEKENIEYHVLEQSVKQKDLIHKALEMSANLCGDNFGNLVFMGAAKTADAFLTLIEFLNIYANRPELVKQVFSYKLNNRYTKNFKVNTSFDINAFKPFFDVCQSSLVQHGAMFVYHDKYLQQIQVHLETNNKQLKTEIFKFLQEQFNKVQEKAISTF